MSYKAYAILSRTEQCWQDTQKKKEGGAAKDCGGGGGGESGETQRGEMGGGWHTNLQLQASAHLVAIAQEAILEC
jgi:hypothetical protein